jgi:hypothetical protein
MSHILRPRGLAKPSFSETTLTNILMQFDMEALKDLERIYRDYTEDDNDKFRHEIVIKVIEHKSNPIIKALG